MSGFIRKLKEQFGKKAENMTDLEEFGLALYNIDTLWQRNEMAKDALEKFHKRDFIEFMDICNDMVVKASLPWYTAGSKPVSDRVMRGWYWIWEDWCRLRRNFAGDYEDYDFLTLADGHARKAFRVLSKSFFTEHVMPQKPIVIQTFGGKKGPPMLPSHVGAPYEEE